METGSELLIWTYFKNVIFISHAGLHLKWKIEMDALSFFYAEWDTCATKMIMEYQNVLFIKLKVFLAVKLANALNKYASGDPRSSINL